MTNYLVERVLSIDRHRLASILLSAFLFLRREYGVMEEISEQTFHFGDTPRTWYLLRLKDWPVELAYSDALPMSQDEDGDLGNTWEVYAVLRIGPVGCLFEDAQESQLQHYPQSWVEILAGPIKAGMFGHPSPDSWDIQLDNHNELPRHSLGEPHLLIAFRALATISACLLDVKVARGELAMPAQKLLQLLPLDLSQE